MPRKGRNAGRNSPKNPNRPRYSPLRSTDPVAKAEEARARQRQIARDERRATAMPPDEDPLRRAFSNAVALGILLRRPGERTGGMTGVVGTAVATNLLGSVVDHSIKRGMRRDALKAREEQRRRRKNPDPRGGY